MEQIQLLYQHTDIVWRVRLSPNKQFLATCCADGSVVVFSKINCDFKFLTKLEHPKTVRDCCFNDQSTLLFVACYDANVYIYSLDGEVVSPFTTIEKAHQKEIKSIAVSHSGLMATCARDRNVAVWKSMAADTGYAQDYEVLALLSFHSQDIKCLCFERYGAERLFSCGYDNTIQLYTKHFDDGELEYIHKSELKSPLNGDEEGELQPEYLTKTAWYIEYFEHQLLVADAHGCLRVVDVTNDNIRIVKTVKLHALDCYQVRAEGHRIATCGADGAINVLSKEGGRLTWQLQQNKAHDGQVNSIDLVEDLLISGGDDGKVKIWKIK